VKTWINGVLVEREEALVSAFDHGMTVGDGVFETCKVTASGPFSLTRHLRRLARSAAGLGLPAPDEEEVRVAVAAVVAALPMDFGRLRITWTGGPGPLGSERSGARGTLVVAASPSKPWGAEAAGITVPWTRNERAATAGLKTTSYAENVVALQYARERGGTEALLANTRGELCEGTGSNVAVVVGDELLTPPLESGCLAGITRELMLEWAASEGLPCREQSLSMDVLAQCPQVVLTSSTRDVQPLGRVDERSLDVGGLAAEVAAMFARRSAEDIDP
jgi:branched-chain amino acid aminotransferase